MEQRHFLFDFDGTLVDSMQIWARTHIRMLLKQKISIPKDYVQTITPLGNEGAALYSVSLGLKMPPGEYMSELDKELVRQYNSNVYLKENVENKLRELKSSGICLHVLTASSHSYVDSCLRRFGVLELFDNVWSVEDFGLSKADKQIYIEAARRLSAEPKSCTMVDDNYSALCAARRAGLNTVAVYDKSSKNMEKAIREAADKYVYGFEEIEI